MAGSAERILLAALALVAAAFAAGCGVESGAASPAVDRFRRMVDAERAVSYQGMKEVEFPQVRGAKRWLFVTKKAGESSVVETVGEAAGRNRSWSEPGGRFSWLADVDLLLRNYQVRTCGRERVVGREGIVLSVSGLRPERPSARLVVDEATGLLLAAEFRDWRGDSTLRSRFTTLLLGDGLPGAGAARPVKWESWPGRVLEEGEPGPSFTPLAAHYLPDGFVKQRTRRFARWQETVYSDGLAWIWMMESASSDAREERVVHQKGEGARVSMRVTLAGVDVRLVGRLSPRELLRILGSLGPETETRISADGFPDPAYNQSIAGRARFVLVPGSEGFGLRADFADGPGYGY